MMSEKRFDYIWKDVKDDRGLSEIHDFFIDNFSNKEYDLSYENDIGYFLDLLDRLSEENEQLRKQIQNYEKLIANSYVGEEERLDGWVGQYVIWEDELQECKNKNEMIGDE